MSGHEIVSLGRGTLEPVDGYRWHARHTAFVVFCLVAAAVIAASLISLPYYAITPGSAQSVEQLIGVPRARAHDHRGQVLLVDVRLIPLRAIEWLWFELDPNAQIVPNSDLLGPETAPQYQVEGQVDMSDAQQAATVVALQHLGYHVTASPDGALVYALLPGSPAESTLAVGQVVTAVDGRAVASAADLGDQLRRYPPGTRVVLRVRNYQSSDVSYVRIRLSAWRIKGKGKNASLVCPPYGTGLKYPIEHLSPETGKRVAAAPCVGILEVETAYRVSTLPFSIDLSSEGIIGPSAGLAFTLGLMQRLDPYDLTGGLKVAATGTMSVTGQIGDVGGVAQKTVAVIASGAKVFFVPKVEYATAKAHSNGSLKIYPVTTIGQVLAILHRLGGRLPAVTTGR